MSNSYVSAEIAHDLRQPLNVIALVTANLRARFADRLDDSDAAYLESKLDRVEQQVAKAMRMLDTARTDDQGHSQN